MLSQQMQHWQRSAPLMPLLLSVRLLLLYAISPTSSAGVVLQYMANPTEDQNVAIAKGSKAEGGKKTEVLAFKPTRSHATPLPTVPYMADPMREHKVSADISLKNLQAEPVQLLRTPDS